MTLEDDIRAKRKVTSISRRNDLAPKVLSEYRFYAIQPLMQFRDHDTAQSLLHQLATDPGVLAVLHHYKYVAYMVRFSRLGTVRYGYHFLNSGTTVW